MALPLWFLKNLKVDVPQKVGLILMLSLGLVIIAFEILRTVKSMEQTSFSEVAVYDIVEGFVAIVVNCIPTYRLLLTSSRRRKSSPYANFNDPSGSTRTGDSHPLQYVRDPSMSSTTRTDIDPCSLEPRGMGRYQEESIAVPKHTYA